MITIKEPPGKVTYVVQMYSDLTGGWADVVTGLTEYAAQRSLINWQAIHPGRAFRPVRRTTVDEELD